MLNTHNLGVVAEMADRVVVMYAGQVVEEAPVEALCAMPRHPCTVGLMGAMPRSRSLPPSSPRRACRFWDSVSSSPRQAGGSMLNTSRRFLTQAPWMAIFPGLAILLTVLAFNLFGDGLRDAMDPRR